jgi:hypothetical protein
MKRSLVLVWIVSILLLIAVPVALAYAQPPVDDAFTDAGTNSYNIADLYVQSSSGAGCGPQLTTYVKWDLSSIADGSTVGDANALVSFEVTNQAIGSQNSTLELVQVDNDAWTETNVGTVKPALGPVLSTITLQASNPPAVGTVLTFPSTPALASFLTAQINGDNFASFALRITGCTAGAPQIAFGSAENAGNAPNLQLSSPTAVSMTNTAAERVSWPLYAGLSAVALFVVAGLMISRRRTA